MGAMLIKLGAIDDLLEEARAQKQSLFNANNECLDKYLEAFSDKV